MSKAINTLVSLWDSLLTDDRFRHLFARLRYFYLKRRMQILEGFEGNPAVAYNMDFKPAAFGCGGRMAMLLFPLRGFLFPDHKQARVLIVGPRTEDDILWARSIGLRQARGLDLFSYSPLIDLGNAHHTPYPDSHFDAVLLGWILPYVTEPRQVLLETSRILRCGGVIGLGWHYVPTGPDIENSFTDHSINTLSDVQTLIADVGGKIFCTIDNERHDEDHYKAIFYKVTKT